MSGSEKDDGGGEKKKRMDQFGGFLKKNLAKGELALKHAAGLGQQPNVVPETEPVVHGPARPVEVGWHPVGGVAGKWFAEETGIGKQITNSINKYPDPTQHWAVLVGDYAHQLWMDENFHVIYTNEKVDRQEWRTFPVGETRFNDDAVRRAGESVIQRIRSKQPAYNLITNNCQTYALALLDAVKVDGHKDLGTTQAVYDRILGPGKVMDLFSEQDQPGGPQTGQGSMSYAQQVMDDNTTQLDAQGKTPQQAQEQQERRMEDEEQQEEKDDKSDKKKKKKKGGFLKRLIKS